MKAELIARERRAHPEDRGFIEVIIWQVPRPVPPCKHCYKYRLVYVVDDKRVVGFDNERGKGDHYHFMDTEYRYLFTGLDELVVDFEAMVQRWNHEYGT